MATVESNHPLALAATWDCAPIVIMHNPRSRMLEDPLSTPISRFVIAVTQPRRVRISLAEVAEELSSADTSEWWTDDKRLCASSVEATSALAPEQVSEIVARHLT